jgi:hypothetical protein
MTYTEIGTAVGLKDKVLAKYVLYMMTRWWDTEEQKCADGYAKEWAVRFKNRTEWAVSDKAGQAILIRLDKEV